VEKPGGFATNLGRTGSTLLGWGEAEFFYRTRRLGARGLYVPSMAVEHDVPASRLTRRYFRRWWWWKGVSRSRLQALHPYTETGVNLDEARRILGVPRFVFGQLVEHS
jgi:hypothetical protein